MKKAILSQDEQGFTFLEVLVGMMIALIFVLITTQGIVIGTVYRVKAQRQSEAINTIQEDLEEIKFQAAKSGLSGTCGSYGTALKTRVDVLSLNNPKKLANKVYIMRRTTIANGNTLSITHEVVPDENGNGVADTNETPIASLFTEVVPDAVLSCNN